MDTFTLGELYKRMLKAQAVCLLLLSVAAPANALVIATADPEDGFGVAPDIMTVDVYDESVVMLSETAQRNTGIDRKLRQTFQNPTSINVGQITIAFNGEGGGVPGGYALRIYEVDNIVAEDVNEFTVDNLFEEIIYDGIVPDTSTHLRFELSGNSIFQLPARGTSLDTLGYAIELSAPFPSPSELPRGQVRFTNSGTDLYTAGRYFTTDTASNFHRDIGLSIIADDTPVFIPGDTNGDDIVDIDTDLQAILDNFRTNVSTIQQGDLSGDGFVDFSDFDLWKTNYTGVIPSGALAGLQIVPEPSSSTVLGGLLIASFWRFRKR